MRTKNKKKYLYYVLLCFTAFILGGCGKEENDAKTERPEYVYTTEYFELSGKDTYVNATTICEDQLYYCMDSWGDEGHKGMTAICRYDFDAEEAQTILTIAEENMTVSGIQAYPDGKLAIFANYQTYIYDENDEIIDAGSSYEIWILNPESGQVEEKLDFSEAAGWDQVMYLYDFMIDAQGNYYCYTSEGEASTIYVFSPQLSKICQIETSEGINDLFTSKEGDVYVLAWGDQGLELRKIDPNSKSLADPLKTGNDYFYVSMCCAGAEKSILAADASTVYEIDATEGTCEKRLNWMDADVMGNEISQLGQFSDGTIYAVMSDYSDSENQKTELILFTKKKSSEVAERTELTLGAMWLDDSLKKAVIDFNKSSEEYHISVTEYASEDYDSGLTRLHTDITSGNSPDIIDFSALDYPMYANKGVFEDLYPYMEKSGMEKDIFLPNVLNSYEVNGRLYGMPSSFSISTIIGKQSVLGNVSGWTLAEMMDFIESKNPEEIFSYNSQLNMMYALVYNNMDEFINWETGECSFNGADFIRVLEFAKKLPEEYEYSEEEEGEATKLRKNTLYLMRTSVSSVREVQMYNGMFGEKTNYIGYPDVNREGNRISEIGGSLAISSKSKNKDAAWSFMQTLFDEEYQISLVDSWGMNGFPVRQSALEYMFEQDMTPEYDTDEDGNQVEQPKTTWGFGNDFEIEIYAATKEEIDQVRQLIASANGRIDNTEEELNSIISEEAEPFFKGQKSASEVANVIQNRIQVYVNENK